MRQGQEADPKPVVSVTDDARCPAGPPSCTKWFSLHSCDEPVKAAAKSEI